MNMKIFVALHEDNRKSEVWTYYKSTNRIIKVTNTDNKKSIIVSSRFIDTRFERIYNKKGAKRIKIEKIKNPIVISDYYRKKLEILDTQIDVPIDISDTKNPYNKYYRYFNEHPDDVTRLVFWFTLISIIISILFGLLSFFNIHL